MLLIWTDNLSVGIREFDNDHKRLIRMINDLHGIVRDAGEKGQIDPEEIEIALHRLENYTSYHCAEEEVAMEKTGFPGLEAHRLEHRNLVAMVAGLSERFRGSTDPRHAAELMHLLYEWLTNHIFVTDKQYADHLRGKELFLDDDARPELSLRAS